VSAASAAYIKLAEYLTRFRTTALELPSRQDVVQYWSGIGFMLDGRVYVAPLEQVSEILMSTPYTRLPGVHHWMKGVANVRGRLMAVMDLAGFLDKKTSLQEKRRRHLVIDHGELYTGLTVDEVYGMQHFAVDTFTDQPEGVDDAARPFVEGAYMRDGEQWLVFNLMQLATDPRFLQVARAG
jgi:twitching motility protein PilI|tara:strand:+ start:84143 stop:84688 length:546 start_codon:yes stop_codon:yes gene_type:complete